MEMIEPRFECQRRPKVLTTIRSTRPATRPTDVLMCLFDITPLSLGVVPCRNPREYGIFIVHFAQDHRLQFMIICAHA